MKNNILYLTIVLILSFGFASCEKDEPSSRSIFDDMPEAILTDIDNWIQENYSDPYNIEVVYRWNESESSSGYQLVPANPYNSIKLLKLIKHLWVEAYNEVVGAEFLRTNAPRQFYLSGTNAYNTNNTYVMGTAEGGQKITLYNVNNLSINKEYLNRFYFKTMHHEFAHILHQKRMFSLEFENISRGLYVYDNWSSYNLATALENGFVSSYARKEVNEDFVETMSVFVTYTEAEWNSLLASAEDGAPIIRDKFEIVKNYLLDEWNIDIYKLRDVVLRRTDEIHLLDLDNI